MALNSLSLVGLTASAFLLLNFAPADLASTSLASRLQPKPVDQTASAPASKGDRLAPARPGGQPVAIVAVEQVGAEKETVVLRDGRGRVVYRVDPRAATTAVSKGTNIPSVSLAEGSAARPAPSGLLPAASLERTAGPDRCEASAGPLVEPSPRHGARCMAQADVAAPTRID